MLIALFQEGKTDKYEIPRSRIRILKQLDSGAFGQVFSGKILTPPNQRPLPNVAVKTLRGNLFPCDLCLLKQDSLGYKRTVKICIYVDGTTLHNLQSRLSL